MYQGNVKDEFKRQHATVMWALDLLPRKYTLEQRAAVVVGALHQNYVLIPRSVFEQVAARRQFDNTLDELYRGDSRETRDAARIAILTEDDARDIASNIIRVGWVSRQANLMADHGDFVRDWAL
jgi:hypothetical protein